MLGCVAKHWTWDDEILSLGFNTEKGQRSGSSYIIDIPLADIADVQPMPLNEQSIPSVEPELISSLEELGFPTDKFTKLPVQDYPNPLATIISTHNVHVAEAHRYEVSGYKEQALSSEAIPPEGITLDEDFVLYADWDFFDRQVSGSFGVEVGVGFVTATKNLSPSLQKLVIEKLKTSWLGKLQERFSSDPGMVEENILRGNILVPQPAEQTDIEGESCILVMCAGKDGNSSARTYPVLLKLKRLRYPLEFLGLIMSPLVFYGEMLPIPLQVLGETYNTCLLARAIGYVHELPEV
jgi:hypothetical protein